MLEFLFFVNTLSAPHIFPQCPASCCDHTNFLSLIFIISIAFACAILNSWSKPVFQSFSLFCKASEHLVLFSLFFSYSLKRYSTFSTICFFSLVEMHALAHTSRTSLAVGCEASQTVILSL